MPTQCNQESLQFHPLDKRAVRGQFDGGTITTDAGGLLLREVEKRTRIVAQFAGCFRDHRDPARIEHGVKELVAQRVYGLALGYEDLNDHEELRCDPLLAVLAEKPDPRGEKRARERDQGKALASASSSSSSDLTLARQVRCDRPPRNLRHPSASFGTQFIESGAFLPL